MKVLRIYKKNGGVQIYHVERYDYNKGTRKLPPSLYVVLKGQEKLTSVSMERGDKLEVLEPEQFYG